MREIDWAFVDGPRIFAPELLKVLKITLENIIILSISTITKFLKIIQKFIPGFGMIMKGSCHR